MLDLVIFQYVPGLSNRRCHISQGLGSRISQYNNNVLVFISFLQLIILYIVYNSSEKKPISHVIINNGII